MVKELGQSNSTEPSGNHGIKLLAIGTTTATKRKWLALCLGAGAAAEVLKGGRQWAQWAQLWLSGASPPLKTYVHLELAWIPSLASHRSTYHARAPHSLRSKIMGSCPLSLLVRNASDGSGSSTVKRSAGDSILSPSLRDANP